VLRSSVRSGGVNPSPEEYFQDLSKIQAYAKALGAERAWFNQDVLFLQNQINLQLSQRRFSANDISSAASRYHNRLSELEYKKFETEKIDITISWFSVLRWLARCHLINLPLGFLLLLTWFYQDKKTLLIRNPFSFVLVALAYPVIIGIAWYKSMRSMALDLYGGALARQFKTQAFKLLTTDELTIIEQFVSGQINRVHLEIKLSRGQAVRRSLTLALLITLLLTLAPQQLVAAKDISNQIKAKFQTEVSNKAAPEIKSSQHDTVNIFWCLESVDKFCLIDLVVIGRVLDLVIGKINKTSKKIDYVPWVECFSYFLIKLTKRKKN
jgi:hypothetical protein